MNKNYTNIEKINPETYKFFDSFAETIKNIDILTINKRDKLITECVDDQCQQVLKLWFGKDLIDTETGHEMSAHDVALFQILTVLKKRGFSLPALQQIKDALGEPMYADCSVLDFAILLCGKLFVEQPNIQQMPVLIIDGDNRITLATNSDLATIIGDPEIKTFSHTVLNLMAIFNECDVVLKINSSVLGEFVDLPPQIATKLYDPIVKKITIDKASNRIHTVADNANDPQFGERLVKYADGHIVSDVVKATEVLNA